MCDVNPPLPRYMRMKWTKVTTAVKVKYVRSNIAISPEPGISFEIYMRTAELGCIYTGRTIHFYFSLGSLKDLKVFLNNEV